jgi:hypothetical protein
MTVPSVSRKDAPAPLPGYAAATGVQLWPLARAVSRQSKMTVPASERETENFDMYSSW